jgi:hypothetical protein
MAETIQGSYRGLLVRIALRSLVSFPCYCIPIFAVCYYTYDHVFGTTMCLTLPFLGLAAVMSIRSLVQVHRLLRAYPKGYRRALNAVAVTLSAPTMIAMGAVVLSFVVPLSIWLYKGLAGQ